MHHAFAPSHHPQACNQSYSLCSLQVCDWATPLDKVLSPCVHQVKGLRIEPLPLCVIVHTAQRHAPSKARAYGCIVRKRLAVGNKALHSTYPGRAFSTITAKKARNPICAFPALQSSNLSSASGFQDLQMCQQFCSVKDDIMLMLLQIGTLIGTTQGYMHLSCREDMSLVNE